MPKDFVMRGQTESGETEVLNFSGYKPGYAYRMTEMQLYPSTNIASSTNELLATITCGKTAVAPTDVDFNNEGLIAVAQYRDNSGNQYAPNVLFVINDTYLITQNLILMVQDVGGSNYPVNWQCRFEAVKMNKAQEAVTNYKQFQISDGS